jgi:thiamine-monophosphate kinase
MADEPVKAEAPSEDALIARYFRPLAAALPGASGLTDDAAVIEPPPGKDIVVTTDALIADVHFFAGDDPADIAFKALAVNVSDLAGKAARPLVYSLALVLPRGTPEDWVARFAKGLGEAQTAFGIVLSGGDTAVSPSGPLMLSITALGAVPHGRAPRRGGAKAGDALYVSGTIGDAALGLKLRRGDADAQGWPLAEADRAALVARYLRPAPRLELREALLACASAAMDISDGLAIDCLRLCKASGLAGRIDAASVPLPPAARPLLSRDPGLLETMLTGGDDYEILAAVPPANEAAFAEAARATRCPLIRIGALVSGPPGLTVLAANSQPLPLSSLGYDHLSR